jgi:large subunit ribosomal protein L10
MPSDKKLRTVEQIADQFRRAKGVYFTNYKGMTVEQINSLRSELYSAKIDYKVAKKTLSKIASEQTGYPSIEPAIEGQMGIAFGYDDPIVPGKVLSEFIKKNKLENLSITGCILERQVYPANQVDAIINLPSRTELVAKLAGTLAAPMSKFVGTLRAPLSQLVSLLKSLSAKK